MVYVHADTHLHHWFEDKYFYIAENLNRFYDSCLVQPLFLTENGYGMPLCAKGIFTDMKFYRYEIYSFYST